MGNLSRANQWLAAMCACVVCTSGCFSKKPPRAHVAPVTLSAPIVPAATGVSEPEPDITIEAPQAPAPLVTSRNTPARPRQSPPPPAEPAVTEKPVEPTIVPEVPTAELAAAKAETQQNLDLVERNLALAQGKKLNPTQQELASKVRGFADNAREAMRTGDWVQAKNLSKKAEVLAEQLAESL